MDINRKLLGILLDLDRGRRSGILRIQQGPAKKQLVLHNGTLVFAESNVPQEHLARIMVGMNLLSKNKLSAIASSMKTGMTSEEALLAVPGLDVHDLEKGRREQAVLITSSLLGWSTCDLRFFPGDTLVRYRLDLGLALPELIIISVRHAIAAHVFQIPPNFSEGSLSAAEDFADKASIFPLSDAERHVCSLLNSRKAVKDILPLIPAERGKPEETVLFLYLLGLVALETAQNAGDRGSTDSADQKLEDLLIRFKSANLYEILSVSAEATQEEIQTAYHEQAKQLHPDRFQSVGFSAEVRDKAQQVFALINEAYLTLRNPDSRANYNEELRKRRSSGPRLETAQSEEAAEALFREGKALLARGDSENAAERLKGSVWLCPEKAQYLYHLGIAESSIPRLRKSAEQHLLKAVELEGGSAESHLALAKLYMEVKLPRKAELHLQKAILWNPENREIQKLAAALKQIL